MPHIVFLSLFFCFSFSACVSCTRRYQRMSRKDLNAVAHCVQEPKANPTGNVFDFLYRSSKAAVAVSAETNSRVKDQADVLLAKAKV